MPPSWNDIFVKTGRKGPRPYTEKAKAFEKHVEEVVGYKGIELGIGIPPNNGELHRVYGLEVTLHMQKLENPNWFERTNAGKRKAKLRYKRVDTDNRLKFLKDRLTKAIGLQDDALIFEDIVRKVQTEGKEGVHVRVYIANRSNFLPRAPEEVK